MLGIVIYGGLLIQPHVEVRIVDEARADVPVGKRGALWTRSGENICPREIEEFLFTHKDVQEVQVFDIPHEKYGEEVYAWIVRRAGATLAEEDAKEGLLPEPDRALQDPETCADGVRTADDRNWKASEICHAR